MTVNVSIVVPAHNERGCLPLLCIDVDEALAGRDDVELILVDDGSTDGTLDEIVDQAERRAHVRCLRLPYHQGQSAALLAGIRAARGRLVVTLDADLQYAAADIPRLLDELANCDVVVGIRTERRDPWLRRLSAVAGNRIRRWYLKDPFVDICCGLKAYRREWLKDLPPFDGLHRFLPAIVSGRGGRVRQLEVDHRARRSGESKYGVWGPAWRSRADLHWIRWWLRRQIVPSAAQERLAPGPRTVAFDDPDPETVELPTAAMDAELLREGDVVPASRGDAPEGELGFDEDRP